jgi:transcription antitermination protein NusB
MCTWIIMTTEPNNPRNPVAMGTARGTARLAAVQALYQMELTRVNSATVIAELTEHRFGEGGHYDPADQKFFKALVMGVVMAQRTVDPLIAQHLAAGWRLARIDSILRAILRSAAFELQERPDVPAKVIINEYVDIAHAFFGGEEPGVVNGILDAMARQVRPGQVRDKTNG